MERAALLRSFSSPSSASSALASTRFFSRSAHRLARIPRRHRLVPNARRSSILRRHLGLISPVCRPSLHLIGQFSPLSIRAVATSSVQSSPGNWVILLLTLWNLTERLCTVADCIVVFLQSSWERTMTWRRSLDLRKYRRNLSRSVNLERCCISTRRPALR